MSQEQHVHLTFKQGSADKIYNASLQKYEGGWIVNFAYGRRGKPLRVGTKTAKPVEHDIALKAYTTLVNGKIAKGYSRMDPETRSKALRRPEKSQDGYRNSLIQ
jgi:hypothetical protein